MQKISFSIVGNQEKPLGNPIPYFRRNSQNIWSSGAQKFHAWKDHARLAAAQSYPQDRWIEKGNELKPFTTQRDSPAIMVTHSRFTGQKHGDAENVHKGIADALFVQDKWLSGMFFYSYDVVGSVDVVVLLDARFECAEQLSDFVNQFIA